MSLIFMEGFDNYVNYVQMYNGDKWFDASSRISLPAGRNGGHCLQTDYGATAHALIETTDTNLIVGVAVYAFERQSSVNSVYFAIQDFSGYNLCYMGMQPTGDLWAIKNGDGTVLGSFNPPMHQWVYIEMKFNFHATTGSVIVKVNGDEMLNLTNVDTMDNSSPNGIPFGIKIVQPDVSGSDCKFDDIYICDTLGSTNNDFLGDVVIERLYPESDSAVDFSRNTGATNWEALDEEDYSSTEYTYSGTVTDKDLLTFGDLSATPASIYAVGLTVTARKQEPGLVRVKHHINTGAFSNTFDAIPHLDESWRSLTRMLEYSTGTTPWTESAVNAIVAGYEVG